MKHGLLLLLAVSFFSWHSSAQVSFPENVPVYMPIPKGTLYGKEIKPFSMAATEVTNRQYREFVNALRAANDTARLRIALVDTAAWLKMPGGEAYSKQYYQNARYDAYPVVNVSKRAAVLYCEWLTEQFRAHGKAGKHVSLPTDEQWVYAAQGGDPKAVYPWEGSSIRYQKKGKYYNTLMCNYHTGNDTTAHKTATDNPNADITAPAESYMPNGYKLYNMAGNVAEMISDQRYTKGGSYLSPADKVRIAASEESDPAVGHPSVGFRPVIW